MSPYRNDINNAWSFLETVIKSNLREININIKELKCHLYYTYDMKASYAVYHKNTLLFCVIVGGYGFIEFDRVNPLIMKNSYINKINIFKDIERAINYIMNINIKAPKIDLNGSTF